MTEQQALQIIVESKSLELYDGPIPDDKKTLFKEAERIRDQAKDAWKAGVEGKM